MQQHLPLRAVALWLRFTLQFIAVSGTVLPVAVSIIAGRTWLAEIIFSFLWIQALATVGAFVLLMLLRARRASLVAVLCLAWWGWHLAPYCPLPSSFSSTPIAPGLRVMSCNLLVVNPSSILVYDEIRRVRPDLICFQEVNTGWNEHLPQLKKDYPYAESFPDTGCFGAAIYSRYPLSMVSFERLEGASVLRAAVQSRIGEVVVYNVHTYPPMNTAHYNLRNRQLRILAQEINQSRVPVILAGDLNIAPWSPHYTDFRRETGLVDTRQGRGLLNSWVLFRPTRIPLSPIDHILLSPQLKAKAVYTGNWTGSDHLPLYADILSWVAPE